MLKEIMEVLICISSFISGDYLDEQPSKWYTRCNNVIEDKSICYEQMTEEEFNTQYQKEKEVRKQLEAEQREIEYQQRSQQLQELREALNPNDVQTIINYIEFYGKPGMEYLASLLNGTYSYESTTYGANGNKNRQYVRVQESGLYISLTKYRNGDTTLSIQKDMQVVYMKTWKYYKKTWKY